MARKAQSNAWSDWDAEGAGFRGEAGVGVSVSYPDDKDSTWLSWDETVALHAWLSKLIEAANV